MKPLSPEEFAQAANVPRGTLEKLEAYAALLRQWQGAVNLVGRDTLDDLWRRHMLDSAQLAPHIPPGAETITDLGSGAGFPGLVLAIVTGLKVHLVESTGKKAAFLREAARLTDAPAEVHHGRAESVTPWAAEVITARAFAPLPALLDYAEPFLNATDGPVTCLFLKGRTGREELTEAGKTWTMTADILPSLSDEAGMVLKLRDISRR
jgi:16S rRNA (guanine527-N7)-methyltransferase